MQKMQNAKCRMQNSKMKKSKKKYESFKIFSYSNGV